MYSQYRDHPGNGPPMQQEYFHNVQANQSSTDIPLVAPTAGYGSQPLAAHSGELGRYYDDDEPHQDRSPSAGRGAGVGLGAAGAAAAAGAAVGATASRPHFGDRREFVDRDANEQWLQNSYERPSNKRSKWMIIGGVALLIVIIIVAVVVGVVVSRNRSSSSSSSSSGTSADLDKAADFPKDSRLKRSFYGIAYTPTGSLLPACGNKIEEVVKDIQLLSQLTPRIRLYGADCNQTALVLDAIARTKVDLQVYLGNYPVPDNTTAYTSQRDTLKNAIQTFGVDHVAGITVGNEFILNYLSANGGTDQGPNSAVGNQGAAILVGDIQDTKQVISGMSLSKDIPIGNADAGSFFNTQVLQNVAYGMANVHPWFANVTVETAANWTFSFFQDTNVQPASQLPNKPQMSIAETGWPTKSSDEGNKSNGASLASTANLQKFIDTFVCQANQNGIQYFFFEFSDEPWKDQQFGGVEGWWGLFNSDRTLKDITIPDCAAP
ncbi:glycoside hydrolase [Marasmius fiardii PR-910]|nr:glycoside hydrolase [Marasmius fiardii PR-910]